METKIIEKIQKLLALSESSNEHEAQLSMLKAQELLARHKLTMRDINDYKSIANAVKDLQSNVTFTKGRWKAKLAGLIADNYCCYAYFKVFNSKTIAFFGREEDVEICNIILEYAIDCINKAVSRLRYRYHRDGLNTKGLENDYALGFVKGMSEKFAQQRKNNQEWGLILVKDQGVIDAYNGKKFSGQYKASFSVQGHKKAYALGTEDGRKFSIADKVAEGSEDAPMELPAFCPPLQTTRLPE